ncbi:MAG: HDIG domain-containing metalloprotein [Bacteroidota bacterium]
MSEKLQEVAKYLIVLGVIVLISTLFPNNVRFKYEYEQGKVWSYNNLSAPFDFTILKSEEEIAKDRSEREKTFSPYYQIKTDLLQQRLDSFDLIFDQEYQSIQGNEQFSGVLNYPKRYRKYGKDLLKQAYERGIIALIPEHRGKEDDFVINVVAGNVTEQRAISNLRTMEEAKELLSDELPYSPLQEPEFLYPILLRLFSPNIFYSSELSEQFKADLLADLPTTKGLVRKGELVIKKGDVIGEEKLEKLNSFKIAYLRDVTKNRSPRSVFLGYILLTTLIIGVFLLYVQRHSAIQIKYFNQFLFLFIWLALYSYLMYVAESNDVLSGYMIPFCIAPIIIKHFFNGRLALFTHVTVVLLASFLSSLGYEFTFMQLIAGIVAVLGSIDSRDLSNFFYSILFIFATYVIALAGLTLIQAGNIQSIDWNIIRFIGINAFLILLAYPLIPLLERLFGFTSASSLLELSDMNRPLLRELTNKAPGTFQHSLQVANLSEAAARAIDANYLLVKVAALYHDIGKMRHAAYFIENQNGINPHKRLSPLESAKVIIDHVTEGIKLAKKHRLPKSIINFIERHHGTTRVEYFYRQQIEAEGEENTNEADFHYPGPVPVSKEETIMMIADSVEAACKSIKEPTSEAVDKMIDSIVERKLASGQFEKSTLNFEELEICKNIFKQQMHSIYHVRVEYPEEES